MGVRIELQLRMKDPFFFSRGGACNSVASEASLALLSRLDSGGLGHGSLSPYFITIVQRVL